MHVGKHPQPKHSGSRVRPFLTLILILGLLGNSPVLALPLNRPAERAPDLVPPSPPAMSAMDEVDYPPAPHTPLAPATPDARALPDDVAESPELVDHRTANSATFQVGPDRYATIVDAGMLHYRDGNGAWQIIDPAFRPDGNGYIVERNSVRSRSGLSAARLSAAVGDTVFTWQATALGAVKGGTSTRFIALAEALDEPPGFAQKQEGDTVLRYDRGWTDPSLAEEILSAPGSLEQVLILSEPPRLGWLPGFGIPDYLEMRATLTLLPGTELWAEGASQTTAFETAGGLEVRDAAGETALVFDPVVAFESRRPEVAVGGSYVARPGDEPGQWAIGLRTPWQWWLDPARRYPAVIDPTMHVLRPTGYGDGIAWVADGHSTNPDTTDQSLHFGEMVLGSWAGSGQYSGYVQFNSVPYLLTNAPIAITHAYLDVEPSHVRMPAYSNWSGIDFEMYTTQHNATLYDLGQCPGGCGGFSLTSTSNPTSFDWNSVPAGTPTVTKPLVGPAPKGSGKTSVTSWDVTNIIHTWNQQTPRPDDGPAFRLTVDTNCPVSQFGSQLAMFVPSCTRLVIPAGNVRLRLEYEELPIAVNQSFLNNPGVPSFSEGVFEEGTTSHTYDLAIPVGPTHWRAAAVRGNHAIQPAQPTRTGLKLVDHGDGDVDLVNGTVQGADQTAVVLIDEHNPDNLIEAADLWAKVTSSNDNDFPTDGNRNYRINHQRAADWAVGYSTRVTKTISYKTDRLINLGEFDLAEGDTALIWVTAPVTFPLTLGLAPPTSGSDKADSALGNVHLDKGFLPAGAPVRANFFTVQTTGKWALAMINEGRPVSDPLRLDEAMAQQVVVEMLRCPAGTIATDRWLCQPVILPDPTTPPPSAGVLDLTIYSQGGFTADPATTDTWCTQNEGSGTPIIGPDVDGRWLIVGQGSVCRAGDILTTTEDSGIGLGIEDPSLSGFAKIPVDFVYGTTAFYPLPSGYPTGVVVYDPDTGRLEPEVDTLRIFTPFDQHWGSVFTPGEDYISTAKMKALGGGTVSASVTVDMDPGIEPESVAWGVPWSFYPDEAAQYDYAFECQPTQNPAMDSPILLASLQLRILDAGLAATGLIDALDAYKLETTVDAGQFRAAIAKVTQDDALGGASKNAQVVVQPPGAGRLPANEKSCSYGGNPTSCLDLRRDDYEWINSSGDKNVQPWELPDVHIEDSAGMMLLSRPGSLQVFSADHPDATEAEQSFSFDTWGATVSVKEEPCTETGPVVTVVRGSASIALPSVGDDGSGGPPSVHVDFKLCQAELRQAQLILELPPPGIAVGSTGVGVNLIGGKVVIDPDFTQIELQLGFQTLDGATVTSGNGRVLIDTRGMFELQASATIVGILDADLLLRVAWNPLDILIEANVSCYGLITGQLRLHAWIGQGWQNKYAHLPDNDDFHFTGSIEAVLRIPEGYIGDIGIAELPPFEISLGIRIAFGEFCTNDSCTSYAWGMSGVLTVCSVGVGMYVDGDGPEFILGTDDHLLIDQFGSGTSSVAQVHAPAAPAPQPFQIIQPGNWQVQLASPFKTPVDDWTVESASGMCTGIGSPVHTCPITVTAGAGRALFTVGWENGNLDVSLIKPDLTVITPQNAASHAVVVSETNTYLLNQVSFGVPEAAIASGQWQIQMSNVITSPQATYQTNYQIIYISEPPPPSLSWNWPSAIGSTPGGGSVATLDWTALRGTQPLTPATKIELFYTPIDQKPVTPTLMAGALITSQIAANLGTYTWDTSGLASGEYAVGGRIDDHAKANGHIVAWAPGSLVISDTTPPPVPTIAGQIDLKDAVIVNWWRDDTTPDLSGYIVEYTIPDWDAGATQLPRVRRVLPHSPDQAPWWERVRLGGLLTGQPTTVCVRAYDASGNVSDCNEFTHFLPIDRLPVLGPPRLIEAYGDYDAIGDQTLLRVDWQSPDPATGIPAGYALSYNLAGCILPGAGSLADQGSSPIDVGNVLAYDLSGLTVGQTYRVAVKGYTADGYLGPRAETTVLFMATNDDDGDGLPDQWTELYKLQGGPSDDPDSDGLTNEEELALMSNPVHADSDGDGYDDGEEVNWGTAVCGPEHPPYHNNPKLTLVGNANYRFQAASTQAAAGSQAPITPQDLLIFNVGGGVLNWLAEASQPWITLSEVEGSGLARLSIGVDPSVLSTGHYTGTITLSSASVKSSAGLNQAEAEPETATIEVTLDVLPPKDFPRYVYLPLITK